MNFIDSVEGLNQKIKSDPAQFDGKVVALSQFDAKERTIIEMGSMLRGGRYDVWGPEKAVIK